MSRNVHSSTATELAKDAFEMAHLVKIDFVTPVYLTDNAHDLTYDGDDYEAGGHLLQMSNVQETSDVRVGKFNIQLSGVEQSYISVLLGQNYINKQVLIYRAALNNNTIIGDPVLLYDGRIDGFTIADGDNSSEINLSTASHWSDFEKKAGRKTNNNSQQIFFAGDLGFEYASSTAKDMKWGRA